MDTTSPSDRVESPDPHVYDEESTEDLLPMQKDETEDSTARSKGKQREEPTTDYDMALEALQDDIESFQIIPSYQEMPPSTATALLQDDATIEIPEEQGNASQSGRNITSATDYNDGNGLEHLDTGDNSSILQTQGSIMASYAENVARTAMRESYYVAIRHGNLNQSLANYIPVAESSSAGIRRAQQQQTLQELPQVESRDCVVCTDTFPLFELANLPCGHDYCRGCISTLFANSILDESLFPPRCCRMKIAVEHVQTFLFAGIVDDFMARKEELETTNKTYCRIPQCSSFIPKDAILDNLGHCTACGVDTCCICKGAPHRGNDCPEDPTLRAVLEVAKDAGWKRCYSCHQLIELAYGCIHMTCHCGAEFCYKCGAPWNTCRCPMEDQSFERFLALIREFEQIRESEESERIEESEQSEEPSLIPIEAWRRLPLRRLEIVTPHDEAIQRMIDALESDLGIS